MNKLNWKEHRRLILLTAIITCILAYVEAVAIVSYFCMTVPGFLDTLINTYL